MMDLTKLRYFRSVAEARSFSGAARRLGVSQPTLSIQVAKLEDELGVQLLIRRRDGIRLTGAGERLLLAGRDILDRVRDVEAELRTEAQEPSGNLLIGSVNSVGIYLLPEAIDMLSRRYPDVRVEIRFEHSDTVIELVRAGDIDVALTASPDPPSTREKLQLFDDPLVLVCGRGHPLWGRRQARPEDLQGGRLVGLDPGTPTARLIQRVLGRHKIRMQLVIQASQIAAALRMVEINMGMAFLPRMAVAEKVEAGKLHQVSFAAPDLHRGIWLGWQDEQPFPARDALATCLQAAAQAQASR